MMEFLKLQVWLSKKRRRHTGVSPAPTSHSIGVYLLCSSDLRYFFTFKFCYNATQQINTRNGYWWNEPCTDSITSGID